MTNAPEIGRKVCFLPSLPFTFQHFSDDFQLSFFKFFYYVEIISIFDSGSISEGLKWLLKRRGRNLKRSRVFFERTFTSNWGKFTKFKDRRNAILSQTISPFRPVLCILQRQ